DLVLEASLLNPDVDFVFAGPILDGDFESRVRDRSNIRWLGDVHYDNVPRLLQTFDVGWIPHRLGSGEVGGDVIKTYEYRAAGLPVLSTPISGITDRGFTDVVVLDGPDHPEWIRAAFAGKRPERSRQRFGHDVTWRAKTETIAVMAGITKG